MSASAKKYIIFTLKLLLTLGLLYLLLQKTSPTAMVQAIKGVSVNAIVLAFGIMFFLTVVQAQRWRMIAELLNKPWRFLPAWKIVLTGVFFSQFLPTSIGGDVVRIWQTHRAGMPLNKAFNSVVLERMMAVSALLLIALLGIPVFHTLITDHIMRTALWLGVGGMITALALLLIVGHIVVPPRFAEYRLIHLLTHIAGDALQLFSTRKVLAKTLLLSLIMQVAMSSVVWIIARDMGVRVDFLHCTVLVPIVILISMLPFSLAGWGLREGAMVVAFTLMGANASLAVPVSVLFGLIVLASGVPGGIVWLQNRYHPYRRRELDHD